jgi:hypothetical protein
VGLGLIQGYSRLVVVPRVRLLVRNGVIASATILDRWETREATDAGDLSRFFIAYRFPAHTPYGVRDITRAEEVPVFTKEINSANVANVVEIMCAKKESWYTNDIRPAIGEVVPVYYMPDDPQRCLLEPYIEYVLGRKKMQPPSARS